MFTPISRREAVRLTVAGGLVTALSACGLRGARAFANPETDFARPLPIPPVLTPTRSDETGDHYDIDVRAGTAAILPGVPTTIWGYNGIFPGPTIKATRARPCHVRFTNSLQAPVVTHLHGGRTPSDSDGFPMDVRPAGPSGETSRRDRTPGCNQPRQELLPDPRRIRRCAKSRRDAADEFMTT